MTSRTLTGFGASSVFFFFLSAAWSVAGFTSISARPAIPSKALKRTARIVILDCVFRVVVGIVLSMSYLAILVWHVMQNAILLAWSFTSRSAWAEECGWWQDRQLTGFRTLLTSAGSITSLTGCRSVGCP